MKLSTQSNAALRVRCLPLLPSRPAQQQRSACRIGTITRALQQELPRSETTRKDARTVYDFDQWRKHRSPNRLIERLTTLNQSNVMKNIGSSVAWCTTVAVLVTAYQQAYDDHLLPSNLPPISPSQACQAFISTTTVALSLLLVFRTNAGYGRWDEARKMWGLLINRTRDLMREADSMFPEDSLEAKKAMARWTIAFTRALRIHLQPEVTLKGELENVLLPEELQMLEASSHRPVKTIHVLSQIINGVDMHPMYQMRMSDNLTAFHDILGGCERILRAPIPVSYTRHTARFLFTWLTLLPLSLYGTCGIWTAPVVAGIAAVLCGIEEIGVQVEEPFGILPLDVICGRIQTDVMSTLKDGDEVRGVLAPSLRPEGAIIMEQRSVLEDALKKESDHVPVSAVQRSALEDSIEQKTNALEKSLAQLKMPMEAWKRALIIEDNLL